MPEQVTIPAFYDLLLEKRVVTVKGLGTFKLMKSKPYVHFTPKTGEKVKREGRIRFLFTPNRGMRMYVKSKN